MSIVKADKWQSLQGTQYNSILQVVSANKSNTWSGSTSQTGNGYFVAIPGLAATITPLFSTSKILIQVTLWAGAYGTATSGYQQHMRINRNGSYPIIGDNESSRPRSTGAINMYQGSANAQYAMGAISGMWLDSPATTAALTYQVEYGGYSSSAGANYVNRAENYQLSTNDYNSVPVSSITLMEIAA